MSEAAFLLVLASTALHAAWNFAARRVSGNLSVLWLGSCLATAACAPLALHGALALPFSRPAFAFMLAGGALQALYFGTLAKSYERGDISVVYPIARGTGVAGVSALSYLALGQAVAPRGALGILSVCGGILLLGSGKPGAGGARSYLYAFATGIIIAVYSIVDSRAVQRIPPVVYIWAIFAVSTALLAPYICLRHRDQCARAWESLKAPSALIGLGSMAAYLIVLFAFRLGPANYVVAIREFSVVLGAGLGILILKEPFTRAKGLGLAAITTGLILIKLA